MTARPDPRQRNLDHATTWRRRIAAALGTTDPLHTIPTDTLRRATNHYRLSPHPDAWIVATITGAELERRTARAARRTKPTTRPITTAAELAQRAAA